MNAESELAMRLATSQAAARRFTGWPLIASLALANGIWLLVSFGDTVAGAVSIWLRSETYAHGLLVVPIAGFLVWRERHVVAQLVARPSFWGLAAFAAAGALWLLGNVADVDATQQFAVVLMLVAGAWALLGWRVVQRLWFPLMFLVFAVPFGDFLLPPLMNFTADFTVAALRLTGMPVYREGNLFQIPSGSWSVVEACSGLRYLIASVTLGALYAYLSYRSVRKRLAFLLFATLAPILANGVRAYMIVMLGHVSNMKLAVGVDHLIYGWVFFGLVMMLMFWVGSLWRDGASADVPGASKFGETLAQPQTSITAATLPIMALALAAIAAFWPAYAARLSERYIKAPPHLSTPRPVGDWRLAPLPDSHWTPEFHFARAELTKTYAKAARVVTVDLKYYRRQTQDLEMINSANGLTTTRSPWRASDGTAVTVRLGGKDVQVVETRLGSMGNQVLAWHWFEVANTYTSNEAFAKVLQAKSRIMDGSDDASAIFLATPINERAAPARAVLEDFVAQMWPSIDETLRRAKP
jgi:exosortase A